MRWAARVRWRVPRRKAHLLIISQTQEVHEEIAVLLAGSARGELLDAGQQRRLPLHFPASGTPAIEKIVAALASPTQLEFVDKPLTGVVDYLKGRHHIDIQLDKKAMDEAGTAPTCRLPGTSRAFPCARPCG